MPFKPSNQPDPDVARLRRELVEYNQRRERVVSALSSTVASNNATLTAAVADASSPNVVVDIDWREVHSLRGDTDLNSSGATVKDAAGAVWTTPSTTNGDPHNQNNTSDSWSLTSLGLEVQNCAVAPGSASGATAVFPNVFINLRSLAQAWGFDGDPRRSYTFECYVSAQNGAGNTQISGCGLYKVDGLPAGMPSGTWHISQLGHGFANGVSDNVRYAEHIAGQSARLNYRKEPSPLNVLSQHYSGSGAKLGAWVGTWSTGWPLPGDFRLMSSQGQGVEQDVVGDPYDGFRFTLFHLKTAVNANQYNAVIQRCRLLQGGI